MKTIPRTYTLAFALTLGLSAPPLLAQTTTGNEQPVVLETFKVDVSKDTGYIATDSLAGGRQASSIRVTPATMSSITSQFINDLNLTNVQDLLKWSLNTVPASDRNGFSGGVAGDVFNFWATSSRGDTAPQGGNPPTKNYFPIFVIADTYNVERVEFDLGPNSILFGIGNIGGAMTSYTKTARFDKQFESLQVSLDNFGGYRGTVDVNTSRGDLALRFNGIVADEKGWRDGDSHKKTGATLAGDWRFNNANSHLRFEIEGWREKKSIYGPTYQDVFSLWNGSTNAPTWGAAVPNQGANPLTTPGAPGVTNMSDWGLNPYNVIVAGSSLGIMDWSKGVRSMGTNSIGWGAYLRPNAFTFTPTGTVIKALPSRDFTVGPRDGYVRPENVNATLTFDHRINENWDFEISGYRYVDDAYAINYEGAGSAAIDLNQQLPSGQSNPNYGKLYSDFFLDKQVQNHWVNEVRGQLSYRTDGNLWNVPFKQVLSVSAGEQVTEYDARQYNAQDTTKPASNWTPADWTKNMVWGRLYWDNPHAALNVPKTVVYTAMPFNWYDFNSKQTIKYGGAYSQTRLWNDRLNISLGWRRDTYEVSKVGLRGSTNVPVVGNGAGNTYSAGAIGYITDWLGVFANKSENYQPAAGGLAPSLFGETRGASFGKGQNYGVRVSTKDGKYYASATWYKDTATDVVGGDSPDFQSIWNDYLTAGGTKTDIGPAGTINGPTAQMNYNVTYDVKYTGVEFELTANPTKNLRLQVHFAAPKGERTNDGIEAVHYYQQHSADWKAVASGSSTAAQKLAGDLATAEKNFAIWAVPTLAAKVVKNMWNAFATYTFDEGALKGLDVGVGATATGGRQIDQTNRTNAYVTESLLIGYTTHINALSRRLQTRFQLNADNLFNNKTLVFQSYNGTQGMDYNFIPARKLTFSASVQF